MAKTARSAVEQQWLDSYSLREMSGASTEHRKPDGFSGYRRVSIWKQEEGRNVLYPGVVFFPGDTNGERIRHTVVKLECKLSQTALLI
jgi:hypothetical protein